MTQARLPLLLLLLVGSGASGLAYQVLWLRELSLVFGVTVYAASTVLAAFMGGLAIGSAGAGRVLRRVGRPILAFGLAEILIGVTALFTAVVLGRAEPLDAALHQLTAGHLGALTAGRFLAATALLIVPTSLMGLTLPLISASSVVRASFGSRLSLAYGVNTAGGVVGAMVAGFIAIPAIGAGGAIRAAAAINITVGLVALLLSRATDTADAGPIAPDVPTPAEGPVTALPPRVLGAVVAASGAGAMALEILWFRALLQFVPATTYAFTTMLAVVLVGLAAGGMYASRLLRTPRQWTAWLVGVHFATAVFAIGSLTVLAYAFDRGWISSGPVLASVLAMLPATVCMGASLPVALHVAAMGARGSAAGVAARVGRLYSLNVAGAVAGAVVTGFWLVPALGVRLSLVASASLFAVIAWLLASAGARASRGPLAIATVGFVAVAVLLPDPLDLAFARRHGNDRPPLWRDEGPQATVSVHGDQASRGLFIDGLTQASDRPATVRIHRTIGHLAMLLHPNPADALIIGLGGGATAGAASRHGARLSIVELNEGVRRAAPWFSHISYDVLRQPGTRTIVDDARSFLATTDDRFDVVTADIIQPTHAGAGGLYSREYFSRVRARLKPGGLVLQWVGLREETAYKLIARTFQSVFPDTTVWVDGTLLVGTLEPQRVSRAAVERQLARPETRQALEAVGLTSYDTLISWYTAGPDELRRFVGEGPLLTDDRPRVEFYRSLPANERLAPLAELHGAPTRILAP
jgi:spermidine synthase